MNISVDAGSLCSEKQFGNYTFTKNLLAALSLYDQKNNYTAYTFCPVSDEQPNITYKQLQPTIGWMKLAVPIAESINKHHLFLATNAAIPWFSKTRVISFLHGLSFFYFPQYYQDSFQQLQHQLEKSLKKSDNVIVSSQRVKKEILQRYDKFTTKIKVLPFGIPFDLSQGKSYDIQPYFMFVGMNHPIKNIAFLIDCFQQFTSDKRFSHYELYLIGPHEQYKSSNIRIIRGISRRQLKTIYQHATAYLSTSLYESFNFPALEALMQDCPVIALKSAIIPELEQFVLSTDSQTQFVELMKETVTKRKKIDTLSLTKQFSWEKYITQLTDLY